MDACKKFKAVYSSIFLLRVIELYFSEAYDELHYSCGRQLLGVVCELMAIVLHS